MARPENKQGIAGYLTAQEMHTLGRLVLLSRDVVEGNLAGAHRSPLHGASSEFADHKPYAVGDDIKHIDYKVLARSERYYIKRFRDETNLRVYLAIDRSNSMAYGSGDTTKYAFACHLAAALGYVTVKARDSIGLFLHADKIDMRMPARNSFNHLNELLKHLGNSTPGSTTNIHDCLNTIAGSIRRRALVVVISDLLGDEEQIKMALSHFRSQRHDVIVFQVLDPMEMDLGFRKGCHFEDLETGERLTADPKSLATEYKRVFGDFLDQYRRHCAESRIDYRLARTDRPVDTFVRAYLQERFRLSR